MDIRDRIRAVLDANPEMSIRSVSLAAGLSDSMLHKFLTGGTTSMTVDNLNKLAEALGVDEVWLTYGKGDPERATPADSIFRRIREEDRAQALRVLETFARTGTDD